MKKMIFLYIVNYADESESAILAINTFLKDLKNNNPKIRGLALRSLCSLKFKGAYEYFANSLYDSLKDSHPYVRKTAVMALLKVYHLNPKLITEKDIDTLYEMIKDKDPLVVMNTLYVLNEILKKEGGIAISGKMIIHLLNILKEFNEWGQNIVLELASRYTPKDEEQLYSILNVLEDKLKHSSAAIVLACTRVFIYFTKENDFIYGQVLKRLRDPLVTLLASGEISGNNEMSYVILSHIYIIILKGGRSLFAEIYKKFFVKFEEPLYIKKLKLEILVQIANEYNYMDILNEMEEYVNDVNSTFAKHTIRKIGSLGLRVDSALKQIVGLLQSLLHRNVDYIVAETLTVLQNILRKYPDVIQEFIKFLEPSIAVIENDRKGLSALIWILGEFGDKVENAPYIIENLLDNFSNDIQSSEIIYSLLLSGCKLFFKTPGEMQMILGRIFEMILKNYMDVDLRDRTYYYYNLMEKDIELAEQIICGQSGSAVENFYHDLDEENLDQIYSQFNTLSVIYSKAEEKFIKSHTLEDGDVSLKKKNYDNMYDENEQLNVNGREGSYMLKNSNDMQGQGLIHTQQQQLNKMSLIDTNDLIGIGSSNNSNKSVSTNFTSSNHPNLDEEQYQNMWMNTQHR
jgi:AP-4 complex subunit beta-1